MTVEVAHDTSAIFEAFKAAVNFICDPRWSFSIAIGLLVVGSVWMKMWRMWVGWAIIALMALGILWGWQDHHFSGHDMMGKGDNIPIVAMLFIFVWALWYSMAQAVNNDRRIAQKLPPEEAETSKQKTWCWPDLVYIEFISMIVCMIVLIAWSVLLPAPLEEPANPGVTPNPSKAPWYFLGLQEMLVYYDPWHAGVVLPSLIIVGLCAIPYLDKNPKGAGYYTFKERKFAIITFTFGFLVLWVFMIITGTFLRGPGWNFFGLFQPWDPHLVVPLNNVNLSEFFWINLMGTGVPVTNASLPWQDWSNVFRVILKEWLGLVFLAAYFVALPPLIMKLWSRARDYYVQAGFARYNIVVFLYLMMLLLPIKMVGRWLINLKYIVDTPWIKF